MVNKLKIYTKTGDRGETSLFGGTRVSKASLRVDAYGTVDELNSVIGLLLATGQVPEMQITDMLLRSQHDLFLIGSLLADPTSKVPKTLTVRVRQFEKLIDTLTEQLPSLTHFILPGGSHPGALLHLARTVCRRAERRIVALTTVETVDKAILQYFNRLSDLLFTMARFVNMQASITEIPWKK